MTQIDFNEMVAALVKPGQDILSSLTPQDCELLHYAVGISGEVGELLAAVLAHQTGYHRDIDDINCLEECGDILFFLSAMSQNLRISIPKQQTNLLDFDLLTGTAMLSVWSAELLDTIKKHVIYRKALDVDAVHSLLIAIDSFIDPIIHKIGDGIWNRETAIKGNIEKLSVRYNGLKYSNEAAQNRADKQ
jgi:hypothetical protein